MKIHWDNKVGNRDNSIYPYIPILSQIAFFSFIVLGASYVSMSIAKVDLERLTIEMAYELGKNMESEPMQFGFHPIWEAKPEMQP